MFEIIVYAVVVFLVICIADYPIFNRYHKDEMAALIKQREILQEIQKEMIRMSDELAELSDKFKTT